MQITARSDRDLTPDGIVKKVADASGAKYGGGSSTTQSSSGPAPPAPASKPVFMPSQVSGAGGFGQLSSRSRAQPASSSTDTDGWGEDAPQVTRSQLEKVQSAYKPTKVNMAELTSQRQEPSRFQASEPANNSQGDVVRGGYQPIGKIDIAAIRREAQQKGDSKDDRPTTVKGAYEPIGKVDIAAIRAKANAAPSNASAPPPAPAASTEEENDRPKSLADRSAAFQSSGRLAEMPKPKVANRFGSQTSSFTGTKAPTPVGFGSKPLATAAPVGTASKTFADEGGKTPAQIWAEKKARERGDSGAAATQPPATTSDRPSMPSQQSGAWQSGYGGKKWDDVQTTKTGTSNVSANRTGQDDTTEDDTTEDAPPTGGVGAIANRFKDSAPMGSANIDDDEDDAPAPPPMNLSNKPNAGVRGVPMPGLPQRLPPPQEPKEPETTEDHPAEEHVSLPPPPPRPMDDDEEEEDDEQYRSGSPPRIAMPVSRNAPAHEIETHMPPPMPAAAVSHAVDEAEPEDEPQREDDDPARGAAVTAAESSFGAGAADTNIGAAVGGKRALVQYDYEKAEENEVELHEGEYVTEIEMVDEDWWMGQNSQGERGLFPANYVELVEDDGPAAGSHAGVAPAQPQEEVAPPAGPAGGSAHGATATAQYDYEAAEENELSFPDGATITNIVSESREHSKTPTDFCRNSLMTTGGSESTMARRACSPPTTWS